MDGTEMNEDDFERRLMEGYARRKAARNVEGVDLSDPTVDASAYGAQAMREQRRLLHPQTEERCAPSTTQTEVDADFETVREYIEEWRDGLSQDCMDDSEEALAVLSRLRTKYEEMEKARRAAIDGWKDSLEREGERMAALEAALMAWPVSDEEFAQLDDIDEHICPAGLRAFVEARRQALDRSTKGEE